MIDVEHEEPPMSEQHPVTAPAVPDVVEQPEVIPPGELAVPAPEGGTAEVESIESPAKVMRVGSMVKQLLDEVRAAPLDERSRERMAEIYRTSVETLAEALSPDLQAELRSLAPPFEPGTVPTEAELRVAQAQLVGWLEGLFHGIQATLFAQQLAARQQLEQMRGQLMPGQVPGQQPMPDPGRERPGTYL
jgi:Bacterial proteasome activator